MSPITRTADYALCVEGHVCDGRVAQNGQFRYLGWL
jgi:hypothetical protein